MITLWALFCFFAKINVSQDHKGPKEVQKWLGHIFCGLIRLPKFLGQYKWLKNKELFDCMFQFIEKAIKVNEGCREVFIY